MIAKIALFLVGAALTVSAQTNFDVLVCKNASYTNATITRATPAYLVVMHNAGVEKVALTNLPDTLREKYPYDPDKAAAALAAEEKKQQDAIKAKEENAKSLAALREKDSAQTNRVWNFNGGTNFSGI